jgi:hypothetical protein
MFVFPAAVMFACAIIIWPAVDDDNYGWANMLLSIVTIITGFSYLFIVLAIWWPEKNQRFWRWWRDE